MTVSAPPLVGAFAYIGGRATALADLASCLGVLPANRHRRSHDLARCERSIEPDLINMTRSDQEFWSLRDSSLEFTPEQWDAYYPSMAKWLLHDNPEIRACAMERLCTAVFGAEYSGVRPIHRNHNAQLSRLAWLIKQIETAHATRADVIPLFLDALRYLGGHALWRTPLLGWLATLQSQLPPGVDAGMVRGTNELLLPGDAAWSVRAKRWIEMLDDSSDYVRACAAYRLSQDFDDEDNDDPTAADVIAAVSAREIDRPGIAGPFWSERHTFDWSEANTLWMLDLLERRKGNYPQNLPFNDIDFYLHELCGNSPDLVRRMVRSAFTDLALMTATEHSPPVPGMESVLRELASSADQRIAVAARIRLAGAYEAP